MTIGCASPLNDTNPTNMCRQMEEYPVEIVVTEKVLYQQRFNEWCWQIPPRCSKYKSVFKTEIKVQTINKTRLVEKCCAGYKPSDNSIICEPECPKGCGIGGICISPGICQCSDGSENGKCNGANELPTNNETSTQIATRLNGPDVCIDYKEYPVNVTVNEQQQYQELGSEWCLKIPPRCALLQNKTRNVSKIITVLEIKPVKVCCEGFIQNKVGTKCVKIQ